MATITTGSLGLLILLILPFSLVPVPYNVSYKELFDFDRDEFFGFISEPMNLKQINPTILDLKVIESDKESFKVFYTEYLVQLPFIVNFADGTYKINKKNNNEWKLHSVHSTCFLTKLTCLATESTISATKINYRQFEYKEEIMYYCPGLLSWFCANEVRLQRNLIGKSLKSLFPAG